MRATFTKGLSFFEEIVTCLRKILLRLEITYESVTDLKNSVC